MRSMARNNFAFAGLGCGTPTSWRKVSDGATLSAKVSWSSASPNTVSAPGGSFTSEPRRTNARTV